MIGRVEHVWFWVSDLDRAIAFYTDVLELHLVRRDGDEWAELDAGPIRLALHAGAGDGREPGGTVVFEVDDLNATRFAMQGRGASFGGEGEVESIARFVSFTDPDGNRMQLIEYLGER
ncbi:MAG TPA: VOC family protein [Actinomycetota bacterium]|nr:VOC family protein [Actinomycetota bacterium]